MFKKLLLVLILGIALIIGPIGGAALAAEESETCTLTKSSKIIQVMPDKTFRGIVVPDDIDVLVGPAIPETIAATITITTGMDWTDGITGIIMVDFGTGPVPVFLFMKESYLKDCKK